MTSSRSTNPLVAILRAGACVLVLTAAVTAQERVMIGAVPAPGQSVRMRMTQEMNMTLVPVGDPPPGMPADGLRTTGKMEMVMVQEVSAPEADGRVRLDLRYDRMTQEMSLNGEVMPIPSDAFDALRGAKISFWISPAFEVLDLKAPEGFPIPAEQLKQMMAPLMGSVPHQLMSVGETVTLPMSIAMPIPTPGSSPAMLIGQTKTTFKAVRAEGDDQVATLEQSVDASFDSLTQMSSGAGVRMQMKMSGSGVTETMVKGGLPKSSKMESTITGEFAPQGPGGAKPMKITGTINMTVVRE